MMEIFVTFAIFLLGILCILLVFVFDDLVLNKHFTMKLREKLGIGR